VIVEELAYNIMMKKGSVIWYLIVGALVGFVVGMFGRNVSVRFITTIVFTLGALGLFLYADRMSVRNKRMSKESDAKEVEVEILSPDAAREWLDDFLVEQQDR